MQRPEIESITYGPLTRETFDRLSISFYDASQGEAQRAATARGIRSGEAIGIRFAEMVAKRAAEAGADSEQGDYEVPYVES